jgi:hypothetical protein
MTGLRSLVHFGLTGSRWLLPWMSILLVSAALTYTMNGALTGSWATPWVARSRSCAACFRSSCQRHAGVRQRRARSPWLLHVALRLVQLLAI